VYFGLQVNDAEKSYNDRPNQDDFDRFNKNKLYANVCIGAAVVGVGAGTFFLIRDLNRKTPKPSESLGKASFVNVGFVPLARGGLVSGAGRF
jgi:hypothetical protein